MVLTKQAFDTWVLQYTVTVFLPHDCSLYNIITLKRKFYLNKILENVGKIVNLWQYISRFEHKAFSYIIEWTVHFNQLCMEELSQIPTL